MGLGGGVLIDVVYKTAFYDCRIAAGNDGGLTVGGGGGNLIGFAGEKDWN